MKRKAEYIEDRRALENFENGMKAIFKVSKKKAARARK
jgi:hypothetical protein